MEDIVRVAYILYLYIRGEYHR